MRTTLASLLFASSLLTACSSSSEPGDAIDDDFVGGGKADGAISEGSPDALGVLAVVNTLDQSTLDEDVGLDARAAAGIAKHRAAADGSLGTADDDRFDTLVELDQVPYVGKIAFGKLLAFARANGFVPMVQSTGKQVSTCEPRYLIGEAVCGDAAWERERPTLTGNRMRASFSFGANDVFIAGNRGTVLHYNGTAWTEEATPICEGISSMWGTSATNLWATGEYGRVIHRTSAGWQLIDTGTCTSFAGIWGTSDTDVWLLSAYTNGNGSMHGGVQGFTPVPDLKVDKVWGTAANDLWSIARGQILRYDGTTWTPVYTAHVDFEQIWGADNDHIFIAGYDWDKAAPAVWQFSAATANAPVETTFSGSTIPAIGGSAANDVWFAEGPQLHHFDGTTWTYVAKPGIQNLFTIVAAGPNAAWAAGDGGELLHWDGTAWSGALPTHTLYGLWGTSKTNMYAASTNGMLHDDGTGWTEIPGVSGFFYDVWGSSPTNIYAIGIFNKLMHYDGTAWSALTVPVNSSWYSIEGTGANDIWVAGYQGNVMHFDGTAWSAIQTLPSTKVHKIHPVGANDVWAAGDMGLAHWDGTGWAIAGPLNTGEMQSVWGTANDLWATGYGVWHYNGSTWTKMLAAPSTIVRFTIGWGSSDDAWVWMGDSLGWSPGSLLHWDGHAWTTHVGATASGAGGAFSIDGETWVSEVFGGIVRLAH
jgi:hypothetical protein